MNSIFPSSIPRTSGTDQTIDGLDGDIVPEGFALLTQTTAPAVVVVLPSTAATADVAAPSVLSHGAEAPPFAKDGNFDGQAQIAVTQHTMSGFLQQFPLAASPTEVATVRQREVTSDRSIAFGAPVVSENNLDGASTRILPTALSLDESAAGQNTAPVPTPGFPAVDTQAIRAAQTVADLDPLTRSQPSAMFSALPSATAIPGTESAENGSSNQKEHNMFVRPAVSGPTSPKPQSAVSRADVATDQKSEMGSNRPVAFVAQFVQPSNPAASMVPSLDHKVPEHKIVRAPNPNFTAASTQGPSGAAAPIQTGELVAEQTVLRATTSKSSGLSTQELGDAELVGQQQNVSKGTLDTDTVRPVIAGKQADSSVIQSLKPQSVELRANPENTNVAAASAGPATSSSKVARLVVSVPQAQIVPQAVNPDRKRPAGQAPSASATALAGADSPSDLLAEPFVQDVQSAKRPAAIIGNNAKFAMSEGSKKPVSGLVSPANSTVEPLEVSDRAMMEPVSVFASDAATAAAKTVSLLDTNPKIVPKPFAEAMVAQVKSVEAGEGRTTVNLVPRGLGSIEVEVISEKDVTSRVVVRVENPAVLQALRDDRHLLAQAIGVSDSSIFDFQEHGYENQSDSHHSQSDKNGDTSGDAIATQTRHLHLDVVYDGQLDILT